MRIGPGYDWGQRSPRWAGIASGVVDVEGVRVHYLRSGGAADTASLDRHAARRGPVHLLVHPMGSGAWSWMDVIGPLSESGLVIAPDLPGSGRTRPPHRRDRPRRIAEYAAFLARFIDVLDLERVVAHGHSMGGVVAGVLAGQAPNRVERLVLTSSPLPGLPDPPPHPAAWRAGLALARPIGEIIVATAIRLKADAWRRQVEARDSSGLGLDMTRISPELLSLAVEEIGRMGRGWRVAGAVDAGLSVLRALTLEEAATRAALQSITAPTVLLWGADDRVIPQRLIDEIAVAHPGWDSRTLDGIGHLLPWEAPATYVELAGR